jgi:hypothetical protein
MKFFRNVALFFCLILSSAFLLAQDKVVYHFDNAQVQGLKGLRNIRNQLDAEPNTVIVAVTHAAGVDLLMEGAQDEASHTAYEPLIADLVSRGVRFEVCEVTMKNRSLKKSQFILEANYTPSGVVRITKLQNKEGFAYLKP